jgi:site-specific DNA-methyltransferase (adenine-specific)/adenine-specific DNA-methyltransferase
MMQTTLEENTITCGDTYDLICKVEDESIDLIVCDGPYGVTQNDWDKVSSIQEYNLDLLKQLSAKLKEGGALYLFGKPDCIDFIDYRPYLNLKSKIIWYQPSRLAQGRLNYTNNYDIICYFIWMT